MNKIQCTQTIVIYISMTQTHNPEHSPCMHMHSAVILGTEPSFVSTAFSMHTGRLFLTHNELRSTQMPAFRPKDEIKLVLCLCKSLSRLNDLQTDIQILRICLVVLEIWIFEILNFRFRPEVKVKWGHNLHDFCRSLQELSCKETILYVVAVVLKIWIFELFNVYLR